MATTHELDSVAFSNNFWGKDDTGVSNLLQKMHDSKSCLEEITIFFRERAAIEEEYSRRLLALSRKGLGSAETGTLRSALDVIRTNTETMGKSHASSAQQIKTQLGQPVETFAGSIRSRRKTTQSTVEKLLKAKQAQNLAAEKARTKFEGDCNKINGYYAQQNLLLGKELEKNNQKLDKVHQNIDNTKREYQNSLRVLAETIDRWNNEWKLACDKFQDLEEERINFLKSNLWAYTNIVSTVCVSDDEGCENVRVALEKCDVAKDIEAFVLAKGTGSEILDPPEFVNFMNGYSRESTKPGHKVAQFTRGDEQPEPKKQDDTELEVEAPPTLTKKPSSSSMRSMNTMRTMTSMHTMNNMDSMSGGGGLQRPMTNSGPSSPIKGFDKPVMPPATQPPVRLERQVSPLEQPAFDRPVVERQPTIPQLNFQDDNDDDDYNSIPVLSHPGDNSSTAQSSPIQGAISPNSSVYSNNTTISSQSAASEQEGIDEPKKRTWASPFRRSRSKKDLKGPPTGWTAQSATSPASHSAQQQNTITAKSIPKKMDIATSSINSNGSKRSSVTAGSVLSMGENMFDLGVSTGSRQGSKSPFDARSRSNSPTKSFARDDPLVMALERLKSDGNSNNKFKNSPAASATRPKSALAPPQPAFTASDMEQTSNKYYSQTQEMFHDPRLQQQQQQQQQQEVMARPRSQVDLRARQQEYDEDPRAHTMKQRPKSVYQEYTEELHDETRRPRGHQRSKSASPIKQQHEPLDEYYRQPAYRAASPSIQHQEDYHRRSVSPAQQASYRRSVSPAPQHQHQQQQQQQSSYRRSVSPAPPQDGYRRSASPIPPPDAYRQPAVQPPQDPYRRSASPAPQDPYRRSASPAPPTDPYRRSASPIPQDPYRRSASPAPSRRSYYEPPSEAVVDDGVEYEPQMMRPRSKSAVDLSQQQQQNGRPKMMKRSATQQQLPNVSSDGRRVLRYSKAVYDYRQAIPEEVSFRKGDILLALVCQADGWWEVEVLGKGRFGLAPSNFLVDL